jgi:hypothetical protein
MRVTRLARAAALVALLAAGCAGEPTGGQVQGATSTAADTTTTEPTTTWRTSATTRRTSATTRRTSATTRRTTTTRRATTISQPAVNPELKIIVVNSSNEVGQVQVDPGGHMCKSECSYTEFPKGKEVRLQPKETRTPFKYGFKGGQPPCNDGEPCSFSLLMNTTVTVTF